MFSLAPLSLRFSAILYLGENEKSQSFCKLIFPAYPRPDILHTLILPAFLCTLYHYENHLVSKYSLSFYFFQGTIKIFSSEGGRYMQDAHSWWGDYICIFKYCIYFMTSPCSSTFVFSVLDYKLHENGSLHLKKILLMYS